MSAFDKNNKNNTFDYFCYSCDRLYSQIEKPLLFNDHLDQFHCNVCNSDLVQIMEYNDNKNDEKKREENLESSVSAVKSSINSSQEGLSSPSPHFNGPVNNDKVNNKKMKKEYFCHKCNRLYHQEDYPLKYISKEVLCGVCNFGCIEIKEEEEEEKKEEKINNDNDDEELHSTLFSSTNISQQHFSSQLSPLNSQINEEKTSLCKGKEYYCHRCRRLFYYQEKPLCVNDRVNEEFHCNTCNSECVEMIENQEQRQSLETMMREEGIERVATDEVREERESILSEENERSEAREEHLPPSPSSYPSSLLQNLILERVNTGESDDNNANNTEVPSSSGISNVFNFVSSPLRLITSALSNLFRSSQGNDGNVRLNSNNNQRTLNIRISARDINFNGEGNALPLNPSSSVSAPLLSIDSSNSQREVDGGNFAISSTSADNNNNNDNNDNNNININSDPGHSNIVNLLLLEMARQSMERRRLRGAGDGSGREEGVSLVLGGNDGGGRIRFNFNVGERNSDIATNIDPATVTSGEGIVPDNVLEELLNTFFEAQQPRLDPTPQEVIDQLPVIKGKSVNKREKTEENDTVIKGNIGSVIKAKNEVDLILHQCPVCLEEFSCLFYPSNESSSRDKTLSSSTHDETDGEVILTRLPCSHYFHRECIIPWLQQSQTCPICRVNVTKNKAEDTDPK